MWHFHTYFFILTTNSFYYVANFYMKKILLSLFLLMSLSACADKTPYPLPQEKIIQHRVSFETLLSWKYPVKYSPKDPQIILWTWTWSVLYDRDKVASGEYDYTLDPELPNRKISKVRWYVYTHIYQDLWLKITTASLYEPYFYQFSSWIILKRIGNSIYLSWTSVRTPDYIEAFSKD